MGYIIEENCTYFEAKEELLQKCKIVFDNVFEMNQLNTLGYFIVGNSDTNLFAETIQKYARILHTKVAVINDKDYQVAAQTICSFDQSGNLHQALLIKDGLLIGFLNDVSVFAGQKPVTIPNYDTMKFSSFLTIMHEVGHIINEQNLNNFGFHKVNKIKFDLYSELRTYSPGKLLSQKVTRINRILYFFVQYIANFHYNKLPIPLSEKYADIEPIKEYLPLLNVFQNSILKIDSVYPRVHEVDMQPLKCDVKNFINYECEKNPLKVD